MRSSADIGRPGPQPGPDHAGDAGERRLRCAACENGNLVRERVRSAFWAGDGLVVIEDIPAFVCDSCGERYFEDETAMRLDMMRGRGFPASHVAHTMTVPVFRYDSGGGGKGGAPHED